MKKLASLFLISALVILAGCQADQSGQSKKEIEKTDIKLSFSAFDKLSEQDKVDAGFILDNSAIGSWIQKEKQKSGEQANVVLLNLNEDKFKDLIVTKDRSYCGPGGCAAVALVSPKFEGYDIIMQVDAAVPVYVKHGATDGLKDLLLNEKFLCKFDKAKTRYLCE